MLITKKTLLNYNYAHLQLLASVALYKMEPTVVDPVPLGDLVSWRFVLPFSVPAVLYCCTNNLGIHLQNHMDPATYQVMMMMMMMIVVIVMMMTMMIPFTLLTSISLMTSIKRW